MNCEKNQRLVAFLNDGLDMADQELQLRARLGFLFRIDQAAVAGRLTKTKQSLEDVDLRAAEAVLINLIGEGRSVMVAKRIVELPLLRAHLAIENLLGLLGKFGQDLFFRTTKHEGLQHPRKHALRVEG